MITDNLSFTLSLSKGLGWVLGIVKQKKPWLFSQGFVLVCDGTP